MHAVSRRIARRAALTGLIIATTTVAAASPALADTSSCSAPTLRQAFLPWGDHNYYAILGGETPTSFNGAGWTLTGGAKILTTTLADGTSSQVLDLPSGSKAVTPTICVSAQYPTARTMVRDVVGSEGVFFYVSYQNTSTWNTPKNTGQVHGQGTTWTAATPVNMQPYNVAGWQLAKITLIPGGQSSDFQIYNLQVDPYSRG